MRTNKDKWNYYRSLLQSTVDNYLKQHVGFDKIPEKIYQIQRLKIHEMDVTGLSYYDLFLFEREKPSKVEIQEIAKYQYEFVPKEDCIRIDYKYPSGNGTASGSYKLSDVYNRTDLSFIKEDFADQLKLNLETYAPRENHTPCEYCGKQVFYGNIIEGKLFYRTRDAWSGKAVLKERYGKYCSQTCAAHNQMAHEG